MRHPAALSGTVVLRVSPRSLWSGRSGSKSNDGSEPTQKVARIVEERARDAHVLDVLVGDRGDGAALEQQQPRVRERHEGRRGGASGWRGRTGSPGRCGLAGWRAARARAWATVASRARRGSRGRAAAAAPVAGGGDARRRRG